MKPTEITMKNLRIVLIVSLIGQSWPAIAAAHPRANATSVAGTPEMSIKDQNERLDEAAIYYSYGLLQNNFRSFFAFLVHEGVTKEKWSKLHDTTSDKANIEEVKRLVHKYRELSAAEKKWDSSGEVAETRPREDHNLPSELVKSKAFESIQQMGLVSAASYTSQNPVQNSVFDGNSQSRTEQIPVTTVAEALPASPAPRDAALAAGIAPVAAASAIITPPSPVVRNVAQVNIDKRKWGLFGVTAGFGDINGADGSGRGWSAGVEFFHKALIGGMLRAEAKVGKYTMGGIPFFDQTPLGPIATLPDGTTPVNGVVNSQGKSPAASYIPLGRMVYEVPMPKKLRWLHPYGAAEIGMTRLASTNSKVSSQLVASVGGQQVYPMDEGTSLEPTGQKGQNYWGGGFGGGVRVGKGGISAGFDVIHAPTGYTVQQIVLELRRKPSEAPPIQH
jgi:hypothetical protein